MTIGVTVSGVRRGLSRHQGWRSSSNIWGIEFIDWTCVFWEICPATRPIDASKSTFDFRASFSISRYARAHRLSIGDMSGPLAGHRSFLLSCSDIQRDVSSEVWVWVYGIGVRKEVVEDSGALLRVNVALDHRNVQPPVRICVCTHQHLASPVARSWDPWHRTLGVLEQFARVFSRSTQFP